MNRQRHVRGGFRWILVGFESGDADIGKYQKKATETITRAAWRSPEAQFESEGLDVLGHPANQRTRYGRRVTGFSKFGGRFRCDGYYHLSGHAYFDEAVETSQGIWTYTCRNSEDTLHSVEVDYRHVAEYYKGAPGNYTAFVYTDHLTSEQLVGLRDRLEATWAEHTQQSDYHE